MDIKDGLLRIRDPDLILKLRSLGAGVEEGEQTSMTLLEAAYLADRKVLPYDKDALLQEAARTDPLWKEDYAIIKHLRDRGYIVRPSLDGTRYLRLHRKGYRPGQDKTICLIEAVPKGRPLDQDSLLRSLDAAGRLRKELIIAIADPDQERPLFLKLSRANLE